MNIVQIADFVQVIAVALMATTIFWGLWPMLKLDSFRQDMFCLRDELFDYAADGNVGFDDPAYVALRTQLNDLIRYGHHFTLYRTIMGAMIFRLARSQSVAPFSVTWQMQLSRVANPEVRKRLEQFHSDAQQLVGRRMLQSSPLMIVVLLLVGLSAVLKNGFSSISNVWRESENRVLSGTRLNPQKIEENALCSA